MQIKSHFQGFIHAKITSHEKQVFTVHLHVIQTYLRLWSHSTIDCYGCYCSQIDDKALVHFHFSWIYRTENDLDGQSFWGKLTTYSGAGYVQNLGKTKAESTAIIEKLFSELWIDRGTRVVFIDFTVYNANINLFCVVKLVVEFPATGGAISSSDFRTVKLIRYVTIKDYFIMACEFIFVLFIVYYMVEEGIEVNYQT